MLMIRLQRVGRVHEPTFRLVLTDSKNSTKSGKYIAVLGSYDARRENKIEQFDVPAIKEWMSKGAKLSLTVHNFLVSKKVLTGKKINALPKRTKIVKVAEEVKVDAKADATAATKPAEAATDTAPVAEVTPTEAKQTKVEKPAEAPKTEASPA
jgi:small subunit ribosomal protein S16